MKADEPRAPFRFWGSKVQMAPWIVEHLPGHEHFVEGCAGSAAVMAVKEPVKAETVNDIYGEVVNFFRVLRNPLWAEQLIDKVAFTPYSLREFNHAQTVLDWGSQTKHRIPEQMIDRAWAFFLRMQMSVVPGRNGWSYSIDPDSFDRANRPRRWQNMPLLLQLAAQRFAKVQVTDWDVTELLKRMDAHGVCIYLDPPYLEETRPKSTAKRGSGYVHDSFDHEALLTAIANTKKASIVVSHYPHAMYDSTMKVAGDFGSHRNVPNGAGRAKQVERLYVIDRSRRPGRRRPA